MKKLLAFILCLLMLLSFAACEPQPVKEVEGTLEELMERILDKAEVENKPELYTFEIPADSKENFIGSNDIDYIESLVFEPFFGIGGFSIVLIRVAEGTNIKATKKLIRENIDPMKWVCTGVEPDEIVVDNIGHLIVLIMSKDYAAYHASFKKLTEPAEQKTPVKEITGSLEDLMNQIYENAVVTSKPFVFTLPVTDEMKEYCLGSSNIEFLEGVYSEPMIGSIPHSIVLIRVAEGTNINAVKQTIKNSVNPQKWICVGVDRENVIVDNIGTLIILIMSKESAAYHASFKLLAESGTNA